MFGAYVYVDVWNVGTFVIMYDMSLSFFILSGPPEPGRLGRLRPPQFLLGT